MACINISRGISYQIIPPGLNIEPYLEDLPQRIQDIFRQRISQAPQQGYAYARQVDENYRCGQIEIRTVYLLGRDAYCLFDRESFYARVEIDDAREASLLENIAYFPFSLILKIWELLKSCFCWLFLGHALNQR